MKKQILHFIGIFCLFLSSQVRAQQSVSFFADSNQNGPHCLVYCAQRSGQFIYLGGTSFDSAGANYTPSIVKLDTSGKTVWTCSPSIQVDSIDVNSGGNIYQYAYVANMTMDDSSVYAHIYAIGRGINEIWRISTATGDVIWRKVVTDAILVAVADKNTIAYTYNAAVNYYTTDYFYELVDKVTGKTLSTTAIAATPQSAGSCFPVYDTDGTTYIIKGDSVIKYTTPTLSVMVWSENLAIQGGLTTASIQTDGIYFGGSYNSFFAGRLNKADGSIAWMTYSSVNSNFLSDMVSDFKVINNSVYVLGEDMDPGNGYSAYHVANFNKTTGQVIWETDYNPDWNPNPSQSAGEASGKSVDADALGNVYVTGYEGGNNSRTAIMGVLKFDPTGKLVYHNSIYEGAPIVSNASRGMFATVFDNRVFFFGQVQRAPNPNLNVAGCDVYMVACDTGSVFNPYHREITRATYQEFSNVADIENYSTAKYAVLKQVGLSTAVELRDSKSGNILWTRRLQRGFYLAADKMCVAADNRIMVTAMTHPHYQTYYDHNISPDSLFLFRFDSLGNLTQENKYTLTPNVDFRSIQLYPNKDTNTALIFTQDGASGKDKSLFLFNFDKANGAIGAGDDFSSMYIPIPGKQQLFSSLSHDTAFHIMRYSPYYPSDILLDRGFVFKTVSGRGWTIPSITITNLNQVVYNIAPCDSASVILLTHDYVSGNGGLIRYYTTAHSVGWTTADHTPGYSIDMGSCSATSVYLAGRKSSNLVIRKVRTTDGTQQWEKTIAPGPNQYYVPMDQKFNAARNQYTIAGFIADTTANTPAQSAFFITVDTNGTIVTQWIQTGDYKLQNSLNTINISQFGQTLIGGALYKTPYGRSGVFIEADSAITQQSIPLTVTIAVVPGDSACSGDSSILIASATGCSHCTYSWSTSPVVTSDTLIVKTSGSYSVTVTSGTQTGSATRTITVVTVPKPTISFSNGILSASSVIGDQWYLNGQAIPGANGQQLNPTTSGQYTVQSMQASCESPLSDPFTYTAVAKDSSFTITISASPSDTVCTGGFVILTAIASGCNNCTFSWSSTPPVNGATQVVTASGTYTVTATDGVDTATATQSVVVNPLPAQPVIIMGGNGALFSSVDSGNQWYLNGTPLADSVGQQITPSSTGVYSLRVDKNGCESPMSIPFPFVVTTPTIDSSGRDSVVLYPNPVKDILHISNPLHRAMHITLYDMTGTKSALIGIPAGVSDQTINIASFAPGSYYVMITDDKTGAQYSLIILKL
jgi:hypothetical protein